MNPETPTPVPESSQPLRSKHTPNFPALLQQLGISVLVTTYQAGKLVVLRSEAQLVNSHFRDLPRPMGLAADGTRTGGRHGQWGPLVPQHDAGLPPPGAAQPARRLLL